MSPLAQRTSPYDRGDTASQHSREGRRGQRHDPPNEQSSRRCATGYRSGKQVWRDAEAGVLEERTDSPQTSRWWGHLHADNGPEPDEPDAGGEYQREQEPHPVPRFVVKNARASLTG
jgi:hypothetical protein